MNGRAYPLKHNFVLVALIVCSMEAKGLSRIVNGSRWNGIDRMVSGSRQTVSFWMM
jgi:hypothetical protein